MSQNSKIGTIVTNMKAARKSGLSGDIAVGAIAALLVGLPFQVWGPGGSVMAVPMSVVWASVAAVAASFFSLSFLSEPNG